MDRRKRAESSRMFHENESETSYEMTDFQGIPQPPDFAQLVSCYGFSPYQRGVYTHCVPSTRGNVQVVDDPTSTIVRIST